MIFTVDSQMRQQLSKHLLSSIIIGMSKHYLRSNIDQIVNELKDGAVIAFPTDTVFGLGCVYDNLDSIQKIKDIKHRDANKPLPMMCSSIEMVKEICVVDEDDIRLMNNIGKGAITYIFKLKDEIDRTMVNGNDTIAIRLPDDEFILKMIDTLGKPMLVTSCNISSEPSIKKCDEIVRQFDGLVDVIVMADAESEVSSTIYDTINKKILRVGIITEEMIKKALN